MRSDATTVSQYLSELPDDRRAAIETVRKTILENLPNGYEEVINWGMITYQVPFDTYPNTYNRKPLMYAALASQKNHMSLYLTAIYINDETSHAFEQAYRATGKRYNVGKSCVRFKKIEDLPLDLIATSIASLSIEEFIAKMEEIKN
jgi:uncharacterized protein YdhG (YjbR/CyaY superfamily)